MKSFKIREKFLEYFENKGHKRVVSAPLIPAGDPTLLFTNAGMVPFKNVFLGKEKRAYDKATSSQKCMRVSGKHNDLENVGHTPRHHTFFEMLGNFSFGDYFKEDAIDYAWDFLTNVMALPKEKLWITIFETDDSAEKYWLKHVSKDRIFRLGEKDNFWSMGDAGPCGPCSEIHWDFGSGPVKKEDFESDRLFEIWNLVFMQFDRDESGKLTKLAKPSIDTGLGLERLTAVIEGKKNNWETDLFKPLIEEVSKMAPNKTSEDEIIAKRVIADHARAAAFLVADGIIPSNEGRGYVLRRILRRAIRYGKTLGLDKPFLYKISDHVIKMMGKPYPELIQHKKSILQAVKTEEERFLETLDKGMEILEENFRYLKSQGSKLFPGDMAFLLKDTYGFPEDLTSLIAKEHGFEFDEEAFVACMEDQRCRARAGRKQEKTSLIWDDLATNGWRTSFCGYDCIKSHSKILAIVKDNESVSSCKKNEEVEIVVETTPFYGEKGGQVSDKGKVFNDNFKGEIINAWWPTPDIVSHVVKVLDGEISVGDEIDLEVDSETRSAIKQHHTATHLLHSALRKVLGSHVRQMGSFVAPNRLRFDFSHFKALTKEELKNVEHAVNEMIIKDEVINTESMDYESAISNGALAFFEDKYGDHVRVVKAGDCSTELCGGTHVNKTGEIEFFKIASESSVASGVRRIEAFAGVQAQKYLNWFKDELLSVCDLAKTTPIEIESVVKKLIEVSKGKSNKAIKPPKNTFDPDSWSLEKYEETFIAISNLLKSSPSDTKQRVEKLLEKVENKMAQKEKPKVSIDIKNELSKAEVIDGTQFIKIRLDDLDSVDLRKVADDIKNNADNFVSLIAGANDDKVQIIIVVGKDAGFHAGKIMQKAANLVGGKGGGRQDMAQGGGTRTDKIEELFKTFIEISQGEK